MESLERLQGLHADLIAHTQQSLKDFDRLFHALEASIQEFRSLLDKSRATAEETRSYNSGKIEVGGQQYQINEEFRHLSNAIGTVLDISEEHAGQLIIQTQDVIDDQPRVIADIVRKYHDRRDYLLQDLRLILAQALDDDEDHARRSQFKEFVTDILDIKTVVANGSNFAKKCIDSMGDIEAWQVKLNEHIQSRAILSQAKGEAFYQTLEFQRSSLFKQHEALGAILALLFRGNYTHVEVLYKLHDKAQKWQRLEFSYIHYLPAFASAFQQFGSPDRGGSAQEAQALNRRLISSAPDAPTAPYRPLVATLEMWWTAEFSGQYRDSAAPDPNVDVRTATMKRALDDGALEFMLSICTNMRHDPWPQIARQELVDMLLDGSNVSFEGIEPTSTFFMTMMMESYDTFAEAWISNMPDSIRKLKADEDERRMLQITVNPDGTLQRPPRDQGVRLHLEAFLVLIAFALEGRPEAAEQFWEDQDSNLYGFLQWASRRQTVPRVSAFCEMLCAISHFRENAQQAHKFLLDDAITIPAIRGKKLPSMNYEQIFAELDFYSRKVHERVQVSQSAKPRQQTEPELNEAESPIMLSCYIRLLSHLCRQTSQTRDYILGNNDFDLVRSLLILSSGPIPTYLRACIFTFLEALLTDKRLEISDLIWVTVEGWASTNHDRIGSAAGSKEPTPTGASVQNTLAAITTSHDQYDAFVRLLSALIDPVAGSSPDTIPFPPDLGSGYRPNGIVPYVDFVCGQFTPSNLRNWLEDANTHGFIRTLNGLNFMLACLVSFNEKYIGQLDKPSNSTEAPWELMYVRTHPFARVMQWIFSTNVNKCLMDLLHVPAEVISAASSSDPKIMTLQRAIEVVNSVLSYQPTYFDLVKPKLRLADGYRAVQSSGLDAIEDSIIARPEILLDLCRYAASEHVDLSLQSLALLEILSKSGRFQNHLFEETKADRMSRSMIEMLGPVGEAKMKHVSASFVSHFQIDERELEAGKESDAYQLKDGILAFLNACLSMQSEAPNLAHLLLGFERVGRRLSWTSDMEHGCSLVDAIRIFSCASLEAVPGVFQSWLIHIKAQSVTVLKDLWTAPVSSALTMAHLRRGRYLIEQFITQQIIQQSTVWDERCLSDADYYMHTSAEGLAEFLVMRSALYDYVSKEIQAVSNEKVKALQEQYLSAFQGKSLDQGTPVNHATVFGLFDFADLDTGASDLLNLTGCQYFHDIDFGYYQKDGINDIGTVRVVLHTRTKQLEQEAKQYGKAIDINAVSDEADLLIAVLEAQNRYVTVQAERIQTLHSYVNMAVSIVECCPMESATKTQFVLQMLQLILPKLDTYLAFGGPEATELTRLADVLLYTLSSNQTDATTTTTQSKLQSRVDLTIAEKLFQLFRIAAEGVPFSDTRPDLRTVLYSICSQYLVRILSEDPSVANADPSRKARSNAMDMVRSTGAQLIQILSDDADDGLDNCRLNALEFLAQLVALARTQNSNVIIEAFVRSNLLEVLLDPLKTIAEDFQTIDASTLLQIHTVRLHLLTQVSLSPPGARALLDSTLFPTLKASALFAADPDLGMDLNPIDPTSFTQTINGNGNTTISTTLGQQVNAKSALTTYFTLLSRTLRLLLTTFLTLSGQENEKLIFLVRSFLQEYRVNMVGVFKRAAGVNLAAQQPDGVGFLGGGSLKGKEERELERVVEECARAYTGLAVGCGFLEFEDERGGGGKGITSLGYGTVNGGFL